MEHKTLTNREVLTALLEGKEIQELDSIWVGEETPEWCTVDLFPLFSVENLDEPFKRFLYTDGTYIYRIKPETKTVRIFNGVELPDCITEPLQEGDVFYSATHFGVKVHIWKGSPLDMSLIRFGHTYKTPEDAEVHCDALTIYKTIEKEVLK